MSKDKSYDSVKEIKTVLDSLILRAEELEQVVKPFDDDIHYASQHAFIRVIIDRFTKGEKKHLGADFKKDSFLNWHYNSHCGRAILRHVDMFIVACGELDSMGFTEIAEGLYESCCVITYG